jgi:iron complex transport system substrate-binding protein
MERTGTAHIRCAIIIMAALLALGAGRVDAGEYIDEMGRAVIIPDHPRRIVSLAPNITETLFALGLDEEIVGVTRYSTYPARARSKPTVGSYVNVSLEKVVALNPDLVIGTADGNKKELVQQIARLGLPVYIINPVSFQDIFGMILDIGTITGRDDTAARLVADLRTRIQGIIALTGARDKPRVFFQIGIDPIVSVGRETLHHKLITMAGAVSITGDVTLPYPRLSIEEIIAKKPDIIVVSSMRRGGNFSEVTRQWERWKNIPAVKNNRIHVIDSDLTDHPSPRIIDGLEALARIIHPEVFAAAP